MFASRLNYQHTPYVSWLPGPQAIAIDAFTLDWSNHFLYAFPPLSILPQFLQKLELDQAQAILITPNWPTQPLPHANKTLHLEATLPAKTHEQFPSTIHPRTVPPPGQPALCDGLPLIRKSLQIRGI